MAATATDDTSLPAAMFDLSGIEIDVGGADGACDCTTEGCLGLESFVADLFVLIVVAGTGVGSASSKEDGTIVSSA